MFSFGYFPGVWDLKADVSEPSISSIFLGRWRKKKSFTGCQKNHTKLYSQNCKADIQDTVLLHICPKTKPKWSCRQFFPQNIQTGPRYWGSLLGEKRPGYKVNHSPLPSAEFKDEWRYTSNHPICFHGKDRENYTFVLSDMTMLQSAC